MDGQVDWLHLRQMVPQAHSPYPRLSILTEHSFYLQGPPVMQLMPITLCTLT